jgi:hypothetical protein
MFKYQYRGIGRSSGLKNSHRPTAEPFNQRLQAAPYFFIKAKAFRPDFLFSPVFSYAGNDRVAGGIYQLSMTNNWLSVVSCQKQSNPLTFKQFNNQQSRLWTIDYGPWTKMLWTVGCGLWTN